MNQPKAEKLTIKYIKKFFFNKPSFLASFLGGRELNWLMVFKNSSEKRSWIYKSTSITSDRLKHYKPSSCLHSLNYIRSCAELNDCLGSPRTSLSKAYAIFKWHHVTSWNAMKPLWYAPEIFLNDSQKTLKPHIFPWNAFKLFYIFYWDPGNFYSSKTSRSLMNPISWIYLKRL